MRFEVMLLSIADLQVGSNIHTFFREESVSEI